MLEAYEIKENRRLSKFEGARVYKANPCINIDCDGCDVRYTKSGNCPHCSKRYKQRYDAANRATFSSVPQNTQPAPAWSVKAATQPEHAGNIQEAEVQLLRRKLNFMVQFIDSTPNVKDQFARYTVDYLTKV